MPFLTAPSLNISCCPPVTSRWHKINAEGLSINRSGQYDHNEPLRDCQKQSPCPRVAISRWKFDPRGTSQVGLKFTLGNNENTVQTIHPKVKCHQIRFFTFSILPILKVCQSSRWRKKSHEFSLPHRWYVTLWTEFIPRCSVKWGLVINLRHMIQVLCVNQVKCFLQKAAIGWKEIRQAVVITSNYSITKGIF